MGKRPHQPVEQQQRTPRHHHLPEHAVSLCVRAESDLQDAKDAGMSMAVAWHQLAVQQLPHMDTDVEMGVDMSVDMDMMHVHAVLAHVDIRRLVE